MSGRRVKVVVVGACGRMGSLVAGSVAAAPEFELAGVVERPDHPLVGRSIALGGGADARGVTLRGSLGELLGGADVVIEFSTPAASVNHASICAEAVKPMVIGTTGFSEEDRDAIDAAARRIPVVLSANMSPGMNVVFRVAGDMARMFGDDYDIEIVETHHRFKKDAPSGTALEVLRRICASTGRDVKQVFGRKGKDAARREGEIGLHAVRAGGAVGEHRVIFGGMNETVEVVHRVQSRAAFADGALLAARFVIGKCPRVYSMEDVL